MYRKFRNKLDRGVILIVCFKSARKRATRNNIKKKL